MKFSYNDVKIYCIMVDVQSLSPCVFTRTYSINTISILVDSLDALKTWHGFSTTAALG